MDKEEIQQLNVAEIAKVVNEIDPKDLQHMAGSLTLDQILGVLPAISEEKDIEWSQKTLILLSSILNIRWLESVGKVLTPMQSREMLEFCLNQDKSHQWKLSPLVVGMSHENFAQLLMLATDEQLQLLKHEGMAEPLQFQLRTLSHDLLYTIERDCNEAHALEQEILALNFSEIDSNAYQTILRKIEKIGSHLENLTRVINRALEISWHTNRIDLIEKLSLDKELTQKTMFAVIGNPRGAASSPTGLYDFLEKKLGECFGHSSQPDALKDEDAPLEALGKFNLWHLEDYWEYGLLPKVTKLDALHLDPGQYAEEVCENHKIKLIQEVQKNLEALGLLSVRDFKLKGIWSRKMLKEYIKEHQRT